MQEPKPGKRIVSIEEYSRVQWKRVAMGVAGLSIFLTALLVLHLAYLFITQQVQGFYDVWGVGMFLILALYGLRLYIKGRILIKKAVKLDPGVPLTRANTADLPELKSLVRASQEPAQAQESVLLRAAAGDAQAGDNTQLLRASVCEVYYSGQSQID